MKAIRKKKRPRGPGGGAWVEHVVDPVREIGTIKSILEPDGLLYIEVPFGCWREYRHTRNLLTHVNFFSVGSLYYLLDSCGLSIRYLKLQPTLGRMLYNPVIVAVAQNSPSGTAICMTSRAIPIA